MTCASRISVSSDGSCRRSDRSTCRRSSPSSLSSSSTDSSRQSSTNCTERGLNAMALSPQEIRHVKLARGWGYGRGSVDGLLDEVVQSFEEVWRERGELQDRLEQMESDIARYRDLETLL